jgi:adenosine deaminase
MDARTELGMEVRLIMCFLRHLDETAAERTLDQLGPHRSKIIGVGLDSSEEGHPPAKFKNVFRRARDMGLNLVAHAGEEGPPEYVWQALDVLGVDRIDHGNRAMEDRALVARLAKDGIPLTVCPLSNLRLCVVKDMRAHPLRRMLDRGLKVTVNSDDPAYFGGYISQNYLAVADALGLTAAECAEIARTSFGASFVTPSQTGEARA